MSTPPTEAEVRSALNAIVDPCSRAAGTPAGLEEMGLVRQVEISAEGDIAVRVVIGVTEYGCLMGAPFAMDAYRILEALVGIGRVQVDLDSRFDWVPEDMSAAYRTQLTAAHAEGRRRLAPGASKFPLLTLLPKGGADHAGRPAVG